MADLVYWISRSIDSLRFCSFDACFYMLVMLWHFGSQFNQVITVELGAIVVWLYVIT